MTAPVRNLTDPTGLSQMAPSIPIPAVLIALPGRTVAAVITHVRPSKVQAVALARPMAVPPIKIPPPPLGRLIFNTFPAVYRDKAVVIPLPPRTGQIFPRGNR